MSVLSCVESRFPLTRGRLAEPGPDHTDAAAEGAGPRPFGLRFFVADEPSPVPAFGFCERRQVTVDEHGHPVVHGPSAGWSQTSTGNMDGNEETKMDQDPDGT